MYIRCSDCLSSSWVDVLDPAGGLVEAVACDDCKRRYLLNPIEPLGDSLRDHYRRALSYSNEHDLDMSCAYSVLLGVMPQAQAEVLRFAREATPEEPPDSEEATDRELGLQEEETGQLVVEQTDRLPIVPDFDLGFSKAIAAGQMTVQQAIARGDREAFAARLVRRHGLPEKVAYRVTDNRLQLREALDVKAELARKRVEQGLTRPAEPAQPAGRLSATRFQKLAVIGFAALVVVVVGWDAWRDQTTEPVAVIAPATKTQSWKTVAQPEATPASVDDKTALENATRVLTDPFGRVLQVVGPDPTTVLVAYCGSSSSLLGLSPIEITSTVPAFRNARLGLFRDHSDLPALYSIRIRRDGANGRWIAGNGNGAVPVRTAPELPDDAIRIPIEP